MEADMAVELFCRNKQLQDEDAIVSVFIGDDDGSAISSVRREADHVVEKWSDINHASKALSTALYKIHPQPTTQVIDYLNYCFGYALKQNKNNAPGVRASLLSIVPHALMTTRAAGPGVASREIPILLSVSI